jgi:hypothetical protein
MTAQTALRALPAIVGIISGLACVIVLVARLRPSLSLLEPLDEATELKRSAERFSGYDRDGWL